MKTTTKRISPLMREFDALLTPVTSIVAPKNGDLGPTEIGGQPCRRLDWLGFCIPFNMTWQPAASLPVGFDGQGLPVGLQLIGQSHDERALFRLASALRGGVSLGEGAAGRRSMKRLQREEVTGPVCENRRRPRTQEDNSTPRPVRPSRDFAPSLGRSG